MQDQTVDEHRPERRRDPRALDAARAWACSTARTRHASPPPSAALKHPSAGVRRNAVQVLPPTAESLAAILDANVLNDSDAQVRLQALLALADMPSGGAASDRAGAAIFALLRSSRTSRPLDPRRRRLRRRQARRRLPPQRPDRQPHRRKETRTRPRPGQGRPTEAGQPHPEPVDGRVDNGAPAHWRKATYGGDARSRSTPPSPTAARQRDDLLRLRRRCRLGPGHRSSPTTATASPPGSRPRAFRRGGCQGRPLQPPPAPAEWPPQAAQGGQRLDAGQQ